MAIELVNPDGLPSSSDRYLRLHAPALAIVDRCGKEELVSSIYCGPAEAGARQVRMLVRLSSEACLA